MTVPSLRITLSAALLAAAAASPAFSADPAKGKAYFDQVCAICHATSNAPNGPVAGPSLVGVTGRKAGTATGFAAYTAALKGSGLTWDTKTLDEFLTNPMKKVPGTAMPMMIPDNGTRADVVAYLGTLKGK